MIFSIISIFFISFMLNYLIFNLTLLGLFGSYFKGFLLNKLDDLGWFNKFLFHFFVLYLIVAFSLNTIYLDSSTIVNCNLDGSTNIISGDYIDKIFTHFWAASAFVIGSRMAPGFVNKHPMSLLGKIDTIAGSGAMSSASFHMGNSTAGVIRGIMSGKQITDNTTNIKNKEVQISNELNNIVDLSQLNMDSLANKQFIIPKFRGEIFSKFEGKNNYISSNDSRKSKIVELIEKSSDNTISDIFAEENTTKIEIIKESLIISPLESSELINSQSQLLSDMTTILSYNLSINLFMVYLICVLTFAFTVRFVIDSDLILAKIKSLPLGKYTHFILSKIFNIWKDSSILWIYFILFFLFVFSCSSTYAIYGCLFILDNLP